MLDFVGQTKTFYIKEGKAYTYSKIKNKGSWRIVANKVINPEIQFAEDIENGWLIKYL